MFFVFYFCCLLEYSDKGHKSVFGLKFKLCSIVTEMSQCQLEIIGHITSIVKGREKRIDVCMLMLSLLSLFFTAHDPKTREWFLP